MGRITEFIDYINREKEPVAIVKNHDYHYITFTDRIEKIGKTYRKERKKDGSK